MCMYLKRYSQSTVSLFLLLSNKGTELVLTNTDINGIINL